MHTLTIMLLYIYNRILSGATGFMHLTKFSSSEEDSIAGSCLEVKTRTVYGIMLVQ